MTGAKESSILRYLSIQSICCMGTDHPISSMVVIINNFKDFLECTVDILVLYKFI